MLTIEDFDAESHRCSFFLSGGAINCNCFCDLRGGKGCSRCRNEDIGLMVSTLPPVVVRRVGFAFICVDVPC